MRGEGRGDSLRRYLKMFLFLFHADCLLSSSWFKPMSKNNESYHMKTLLKEYAVFGNNCTGIKTCAIISYFHKQHTLVQKGWGHIKWSCSHSENLYWLIQWPDGLFWSLPGHIISHFCLFWHQAQPGNGAMTIICLEIHTTHFHLYSSDKSAQSFIQTLISG